MNFQTHMFVITAVYALFATGCATSRPQLPQTIDESQYKGTEYALVVGALSRQNGVESYGVWRLEMRHKQNKDLVPISLIGSTGGFVINAYDFDYRESQFSGNFFAYILPAGEYEFYDYALIRTSGAFQTTAEPEDEFSVPFSVVPGKINYIGDYLAVEDFTWEIRDNRKRDIRELSRRYPNLDWSDVVDSIPAESNIESVYINLEGF